MREHNGRNSFFHRICIAYLPALAIGILIPVPMSGSNSACSAHTPSQDFYVNTNGDVTNTGLSREGPVCVQVHYNRLRFNLSVNFQTTYSKGPDVQSALLTGPQPTAKPGGVVPEDANTTLLNKIRASLNDLVAAARAVDDGVKLVKDLVTFLDASVGPGKAFPEDAVRDKYEALEPALQAAEQLPLNALPTDLAFGNCPSTPPAAPAPGSALAMLQGLQADAEYYPTHKDLVDQALGLANLFRCGGTGETEVVQDVAILKFWDSRFLELGLQNNMTHAQLQQVSLAGLFVDATQLNCPNVFNQSSSTAASLTAFDESQTLSGNFNNPSPHQVQNFFSLTCASPFTVSAGIEFSTIPAREFGIIKSAGGPNNTSINTFGLTSDSAFHPLPVALAHVRLWESPDRRLAAHATAGASGNIQGQNSGGSSAEFLIGGSLSFFRTMFFSVGLHVGTESTLAGGFKVGQPVPSDISSVQVSKSYTKGVGVAITFTKP